MRVSYLSNKNVRKYMDQGFSCVLYAGGFKEIVGFDNTEELIYTGTYGYWFRIGREYGARVVTSLIYDGSVRYFSQSGVLKKERLKLASAKIPILLPTAASFPSRDVPMYIRHIMWTREQVAHFDLEEVHHAIRQKVKEDRVYHTGRAHVFSNT